MNNGNHVPVSEPAAPRVGLMKARRGRPRKDGAHDNVVPEPNGAHEIRALEPINGHENVVPEPAADETVTPERGLLLATLRVWELKNGISE